jgi:hypothetical protein
VLGSQLSCGWCIHVVTTGASATGPEYVMRQLRRSDARGRAPGGRADESDLSCDGLAVSASAADRGWPRPPASGAGELVLYEVSSSSSSSDGHTCELATLGYSRDQKRATFVSRARQDSGYGLSAARKRMRPHSVTPIGVRTGRRSTYSAGSRIVQIDRHGVGLPNLGTELSDMTGAHTQNKRTGATSDPSHSRSPDRAAPADEAAELSIPGRWRRPNSPRATFAMREPILFVRYAGLLSRSSLPSDPAVADAACQCVIVPPTHRARTAAIITSAPTP